MMRGKTAIVVLGMHRSGTSSVAGALTLLGAASPRTLMPAAVDNPKGFWESQLLMEFHDRLLEAGGSNWRDWRSFNLSKLLSEHPEILSEAQRSLSIEFGKEDLIVLKDPRICRFFALWQTILEADGYEVAVVMPLRSPVEVAASLTARNAMGFEEACRLWLRHVLDAERSSRGLKRLVLDWSDFLNDWRGAVIRMEDLFCVSLRSNEPGVGEQVDDFLTTELRRQTSDGQTAPDMAHEAYALLSGAARGGGIEGIEHQLDEIRWAFDQSCVLFADAPR